MHAELPVVQVKRTILVFFDEGDRLLRHAVLDVLAGFGGLEFGKCPGRDEIARRSRARPVRDVHVEPLLERRVGRMPQMPLAEMPGGVAVGLHHVADGVIFGVEPARGNEIRRLPVGMGFSGHLGLEGHAVFLVARVGEHSGLAE